MPTPEIQAAQSLFQIATQAEKLGIVAVLFIICLVLAWLLKRAVSDKQEVLRMLAEDKADRDKLNDKIVDGMARMNQTQEEMKNILRQQQDLTATMMKIHLEGR